MKLITKGNVRFTCLLFATSIFTQQWEVFADEEVSFYGKRGVITPASTPGMDEDQDIDEPKYYRRVIAPPISENTVDVQEYTDIDVHPAALISQDTASTLSKSSSPIPLSRNELLLAKKAEYYIQRNFNNKTGLWNSVQGYPHTTMWDVASGIAATLALEALGLKTRAQAHHELNKTLTTLHTIPLYKGLLPNREYSTKSAKPSGRLSDTRSNGNGWSALDIGRLLVWLKILEQQHPELIADIQRIVNRWSLDKAISDGTLYGTKLYKGKEYYRQEGRNGYLQYAAQGFKMFQFDVPLPDLKTYLQNIEIDDITIAIDSRNVPFLTSDPYVLSTIEYGDSQWSQLLPFYDLHKQRWEKQNILSAYAEDAMNKNPWFAYNNVYYYGKSWTSVSPSGQPIENPQILSNKVAFGFSVLFEDEFSKRLYEDVLESSLKFRGIPTGKYANGGINSSMNINTNSLVLVALWYKTKGRSPILE